MGVIKDIAINLLANAIWALSGFLLAYTIKKNFFFTAFMRVLLSGFFTK
jgi:hypothetical protein